MGRRHSLGVKYLSCGLTELISGTCRCLGENYSCSTVVNPLPLKVSSYCSKSMTLVPRRLPLIRDARGKNCKCWARPDLLAVSSRYRGCCRLWWEKHGRDKGMSSTRGVLLKPKTEGQVSLWLCPSCPVVLPWWDWCGCGNVLGLYRLIPLSSFQINILSSARDKWLGKLITAQCC